MTKQTHLDKADARYDAVAKIAARDDWTIERWATWWLREFKRQDTDRAKENK